MRKIVLLLVIAMSSTSCAALGFGSSCGDTELIAEFDQVGDLVENSNVQSRDVIIGSIQKIELDEWTARVTMCINKEEQIPTDTRAVVRTTSLLGEKFIDLQTESRQPPFLESGDIIPVERTRKATELEDVFAELAGILGAGNLEQINEFTKSQRTILEGKAGNLRALLTDLREFTDVLSDRRTDISAALSSLDDVSTTVLADRTTLESFLESFGDSSAILAAQKEGLQELLLALDEFSAISLSLLEETEEGINKQFDKLRPVLTTLVNNSGKITRTLRTLATYSEWFPDSMPGDYLQLDVCQAPPEHYGQGVTCPQNDQVDDPDSPGAPPASILGPDADEDSENAVEHILRQPLDGSDD
jgi:phospholipid/cholesterol/gamma-HCH transport system substrate-binding protein